MVKHIKLLAALTSILAFAACMTTGQNEDGLPELDGREKKLSLVKQIGKEAPIASKNNRGSWISISQSKKSSEANKLRATHALGEYGAAESMARNILKLRPGNPDALEGLATALVMQSKYDLAEYYAKQLRKKQPDSPIVSNVMGLAIMNRTGAGVGELTKAEALFANAFNADSRQIAPGLNLGYLQLETGRAEAAKDTFKRVASRCNQCAASLVGVGFSSIRLKDWKAARSSLSQVVKQNPQNAQAIYYLASVYQAGFGDNKKSISLLEQLLQLRSSEALAWHKPAQSMLRSLKGEAIVEDRIRAESAPVTKVTDSYD